MTSTARTYGGALFDLAREDGLEDELLHDIGLVLSVWTELPKYQKLLSAPAIPKKERLALLDEAWDGRVHPHLLHFLKLLCEKGLLRDFPGCAEEYRHRFNEARGILAVCAVTAAPMREQTKDRLRKKLEELTGKQVELRTREDDSLLGGVRLELPDRQLDGTVRHHLDEIRRMLDNTMI